VHEFLKFTSTREFRKKICTQLKKYFKDNFIAKENKE
jgi:hypothetical protein